MPNTVGSSVTLHEAARRLKVHYMTVYRYVRSGRLPARQEDGEWKVLVSDIQAFAAARKQRPARSGAGKAPRPNAPSSKPNAISAMVIMGIPL